MEPDLPLIDELKTLRRQLHTRPELSGEEEDTARTIAAWLSGCNPSGIITGLGGHGVAAVFDSGKPGKTVMLRCELDGLPIAETGTPPWRSEVPGKGHMCGHDGHMAIMAGVARRLAQKLPATGRAVLLFQPAEETGAGAQSVLDDPQFAALQPDLAFGLHNLPGLETGVAAVHAGPYCFASEGLTIHLEGWTSHAAHPENGRSPARAVSRLIEALPDLPHKLGMAEGTALVTLGHVKLGEPCFGIAPGTATVMATLRAQTDTLQKSLFDAAMDLARSIAAEEGLELSFSQAERFAACFNDEAAVAIVRDACRAANVTCLETANPYRWSEDFGLFTGVSPAAFFVLGAGTDHPQLHNPDYDFPDDLIAPAVAIFEAIIDATNGRS